jgi:uncharacterized membrane protein
MDRMLVVVFDNEAKVFEARTELLRLDGEDAITIYAHALIAKNADGTASVNKHKDTGPIRSLLGFELGSLISILSGPAILAVGMGTGFLVGGAVDLHTARIGKDFVEDVSRELQRNRFALVAEIEEESTTRVDTRMEAIGGTVLRRALADVKHTIHEEHVGHGC